MDRLPLDPFGRSRLPGDLDERRHRVRMIRQAAAWLLAHGGESGLFVGGALTAWLSEGGQCGSLERQYLRTTPQRGSTKTVVQIAAEQARFEEDLD